MPPSFADERRTRQRCLPGGSSDFRIVLLAAPSHRARGATVALTAAFVPGYSGVPVGDSHPIPRPAGVADLHPGDRSTVRRYSGRRAAPGQAFPSRRPPPSRKSRKTNGPEPSDSGPHPFVFLFRVSGLNFELVGATGLEPATSRSRTVHATNCATPRPSGAPLSGGREDPYIPKPARRKQKKKHRHFRPPRTGCEPRSGISVRKTGTRKNGLRPVACS